MATKVESDKQLGHLELIDTDRDCDMPGCHQRVAIRVVEYGNGREWIGNHYCGFHAAALYGRREGSPS